MIIKVKYMTNKIFLYKLNVLKTWYYTVFLRFQPKHNLGEFVLISGNSLATNYDITNLHVEKKISSFLLVNPHNQLPITETLIRDIMTFLEKLTMKTWSTSNYMSLISYSLNNDFAMNYLSDTIK